MPNIGPLEIGIVLIVVLVIFGPKRLPEFGSSLGQGIRGFGHGINGERDPSADALSSPDDAPGDDPVAAVGQLEPRSTNP